MLPLRHGNSDFLNTANNMNGMNNIPGNGTSNIMDQVNTNSYAQGVLQKNIGITGYFFVSFPDSVDWRDKIFYGVLLMDVLIFI